MRKSRKEPIPEHFHSAEEAGEFWDTHDLADYWSETKKADLFFNLKRKHYYISVDPEIVKRLEYVSERQGLSIETLANLWLQERLQNISRDET